MAKLIQFSITRHHFTVYLLRYVFVIKYGKPANPLKQSDQVIPILLSAVPSMIPIIIPAEVDYVHQKKHSTLPRTHRIDGHFVVCTKRNSPLHLYLWLYGRIERFQANNGTTVNFISGTARQNAAIVVVI
jgi:hypothetical protein